MPSNKQKLELNWIGKENRPKLEPRILVEDPEKSYHAPHRVGENDLFDNKLIFGDNLLALKALEQEYAGKVKCVYIDPPFNTGEAFEHYDDGVEHSLWLSLLRDRITLLHSLLHPTGTLAIHIDDNELCYLTALTDEIFFRRNRINIITFKQSSVSGPKSINPGLVSTANYILIYAKNKDLWKPNRIYQKTARDPRYSRYIANMKECHSKWKLITLKKAFAAFHKISEEEIKAKFADKLEEKLEEFVIKNAEAVVRTARVADKDVNETAREALAASRTITNEVQFAARDGKSDYYFLGGEQLIFYSSKVQIIDGQATTALAASNLWDDLLSNNLHKEGDVSFKKGKKPEGLIKRIMELATNPGDLVLDSFLGSGTTAAVAHKMGRRWIGIELGEHCHTHCLPRLQKVIDGEDPGGITKAVEWKGGGGFRYYKIAPSLLEKDKWDNWVISKEYNAAMLAEAVCKLEGFVYAPSDSLYWQQGHSTEQDFIYTTTASLTHAQLQQLSDEVGPERSLLVVCTSFRGAKEGYPNLTVKKVPKAVLNRCEWGKDDYSLRVENLPKAPPQPGQQELF
jgi:adenine-specific DNA-methyltransferase